MKELLKSSFNRLYEPYCLKSAHKIKINGDQPKEQVIREYDYETFPDWFIQKWNIDFTVLTKHYFESKLHWYILKNNKKLSDQYALYEYPERMINAITDLQFWLPIYKHWLIKYNEYNELVVRTHINNPDSRLGIGIFTKKLRSSTWQPSISV